MSVIAESHVEEAALAWLSELGFAVAEASTSAQMVPPERASYGDVVLDGRLRAAIARLNPHLNAETREEVLRKLTRAETPVLIEENRRTASLPSGWGPG